MSRVKGRRRGLGKGSQKLGAEGNGLPCNEGRKPLMPFKFEAVLV